MNKNTNQRNGELLRGVFKILLEFPDGLRAQEVLKRLEKLVPPTSSEASDYPNRPGVRRFEKKVRFATVGCVKAGWLEKSKGRWTLTEQGKTAYHQFSDPENFRREIHKPYKVWADANLDEDQIEPESESEGENGPSISFEKADEQSWAEIESYVQKIDPYDFQNKLVVGLLKGMGYHVAHAARPGADGGIDIIAYPDPLGTTEPTIKVSVRRRVSQKTDVKELREFLSILHGNDVGIFVSISGFTSEAERASRTEQRRIRLVDLEKLFDLWVEHYDRIPEAERTMLPLKPVWFLAKDEQP